MVLLQLLAGAHINDVTPQKSTALHIAAVHDRANITAALLSEHINYDAVDDALNNGKAGCCGLVTQYNASDCYYNEWTRGRGLICDLLNPNLICKLL